MQTIFETNGYGDLISVYNQLDNCSKPKKTFNCDLCTKIYLKKDSLRKHLKKHSFEVCKEQTIKTEFCHICNEEFPIATNEIPNYKFHIVTIHANIIKHNGMEAPSIECKECQKLFKTKILFRRHWEIHRFAKFTLKCTYCSISFQNVYQYKKHITLKHQHCKCTICYKPFTNHHSLTRHSKKHSSEFQEASKHRTQLEQHSNRLNEKQKLFICDICGHTTKQKVVLQKHLLTHQTVPEKCDQCHKFFKNYNSLKHHKSTIHVLKKFVCTFCGIGFAQKTLLNKHENITHKLKEDLFVACGICDKTINRYQMKTHMLQHNGESPFVCDICNDQFRAKRTLVKHQNQYNHLV